MVNQLSSSQLQVLMSNALDDDYEPVAYDRSKMRSDAHARAHCKQQLDGGLPLFLEKQIPAQIADHLGFIKKFINADSDETLNIAFYVYPYASAGHRHKKLPGDKKRKAPAASAPSSSSKKSKLPTTQRQWAAKIVKSENNVTATATATTNANLVAANSMQSCAKYFHDQEEGELFDKLYGAMQKFQTNVDFFEVLNTMFCSTLDAMSATEELANAKYSLQQDKEAAAASGLMVKPVLQRAPSDFEGMDKYNFQTLLKTADDTTAAAPASASAAAPAAASIPAAD